MSTNEWLGRWLLSGLFDARLFSLVSRAQKRMWLWLQPISKLIGYSQKLPRQLGSSGPPKPLINKKNVAEQNAANQKRHRKVRLLKM